MVSGEVYSLDGACNNRAEEFFSRMRRSEIGHHHHIAGPYLLRYAQSQLARGYRRLSNVDRYAALPDRRCAKSRPLTSPAIGKGMSRIDCTQDYGTRMLFM
jgi:hypothetical protein